MDSKMTRHHSGDAERSLSLLAIEMEKLIIRMKKKDKQSDMNIKKN